MKEISKINQSQFTRRFVHVVEYLISSQKFINQGLITAKEICKKLEIFEANYSKHKAFYLGREGGRPIPPKNIKPLEKRLIQIFLVSKDYLIGESTLPYATDLASEYIESTEMQMKEPPPVYQTELNKRVEELEKKVKDYRKHVDDLQKTIENLTKQVEDILEDED